MGTSNALTVHVYDGRGRRMSQCTVAGFVQLMQWTHVAVVLDGKRVTVYKDANYKRSCALLSPPRKVVRTRNYIGRSNWKGDALLQADIDVLRVRVGAAWSQKRVLEVMGKR